MTPEQFKDCRLRMGLGRRDLAKLLGYNHAEPDQDYNTIKRLETGARPISPMCARLMTLIYRHWTSTGHLPEFEGEQRDERDYDHG